MTVEGLLEDSGRTQEALEGGGHFHEDKEEEVERPVKRTDFKMFPEENVSLTHASRSDKQRS